MITPAYALTATERVLPRLALDFTTASLDSRVTVTRALNTATTINSSGFIATVNADLPRFDFNPSTLLCRGLLIEESRANLLLRSSDLSASWSLLRATSSQNAGTAPDNTNSANLLLNTAVSGTHVAIQTITKAASAISYSASVYLKASVRSKGELRMSDQAGNGARVTFDLVAGSVGTPAVFGTGFTLGTASIVSMPNSWYRVILTATSNTATTLGFECYVTNDAYVISYAGDGTGFYFWGAQLETGAFPTSYIPTTTTSLTRNADAVDMTGTNFSGWYNASEGTLFAEATTFSNAATDKFVANINNNGFPNRILMNFTATNNFSASVVSNSVSQVSGTNGSSTTLNTPIKMCFATKLDNFAWSQSGVSPSTDVSGAMPVTVDRLWIGGANTTAFLNGHMRQVKFWPQRLINAEVQAFSK